MRSLKSDLWFSDNDSLLWSANWIKSKKIELSVKLNNHWILDNYSSIDFLRFLVWDKNLNKILLFKEKLIKLGIEWLSLDIDETLSLTSTYWFDRLLDEFWNPENLTAEEMAEKYHLCQNVPYWKSREDISNKMYWFRDDDKFQVNIPVIWWVIENYRLIHEDIIPILSYITVRPDVVSLWTKKWLEYHEFPNAEVIHIPWELEYLFWNLWKACILDLLYPNIVWIVDDNPKLIELIPKRYNWSIFLFNKKNLHKYNHVIVHVSETVDEVLSNVINVYSK